MSSLILSTATRYLLPLLLLFSVFVLFRGHDEPGGGFVGGLIAAAAYALYALAFDTDVARRVLWLDPHTLIALGLALATGAGGLALAAGQPFLTGIWSDIWLPVAGKLGTPMFFDIGVYLVVVGMATLIVFTLAEE